MAEENSSGDTITAPESTLRFHLWDDAASATKDLFFIKTATMVLDVERLVDLRRILAEGPQEKAFATYTFCSPTGATIPDVWLGKDYVALVNSDSTEPAKKKTYSETNLPTLGPGPFNFYVKKPTSRGAATEVPPAKAPDIDLSRPTAPDLPSSAGGKEQTSSYQSDAYTAATSESVAEHVADLGEREWAIVAQNNALLYGLAITRQKPKDPKKDPVTIAGIDYARRQAFQFKKRNLHSFALSADLINDTLIPLRLPDFHVDDQSYVSVFETKNSFQSSLATSGFSETDVQASAEGGFCGISVSASAGYGETWEEASSSTTMDETNRMHISYNFPRVTTILDEECLELTEQCAQDIALVKDSATLKTFLDSYGQFFATRVQVGGRLFASDESSTVFGSTTYDKAKSMKASASASINTAFGSASASASHGESEQEAGKEEASKFLSDISWQATGGNTLLCNNPAAWCPTVSSFYTWRTTKQDNVLHMVDLIGRMPGYDKIPGLFEKPDEGIVVTAPDKIYLEQSSTLSKKTFFTVALPAIRSLAHVLASAVSQGPDVVTNVAAYTMCFLANAKLQSVAACYDAVGASDSNLSGQELKVEALDGSPVKQASFETPYRIKNSKTGMGPAVRNTDENIKCVEASITPGPIIFRNPALKPGEGKKVPIETNSSVLLVFCDPVDTDKPAVGYATYTPYKTDTESDYFIKSDISVTGVKAAEWYLRRR